LLLVGLVMTNDLHGLMFKLDFSQPGWSQTGNYSYGVIFYVFTAAVLVELIAAIIVMFTKSRHSPRRYGVVFPFVFIAVLITYIVGYTTGAPLAVESDVTLVYSAFTLLFLELCVRTGQIPVNVHYRNLFKNTGKNLLITDSDGNNIFASDGAEPIDALIWDKLKKSDIPAMMDGNRLFLKNRISGGYAVWQEDITAVNKLKSKIEMSNKRIEAANAILTIEAQRKEQEAKAKAKLELYMAFEKNIAAHEDRLEHMLRSIPGSEPERAAHIGAAAVLVCYIKRRCNLLTLEMSGETSVSWDGFTVYFDELTELAKLAGIQALNYCNLSGDITLRRAVAFYSFFELALEGTITNENAGIVANTVIEDGKILMKLLVSGDAVMLNLPLGIAKEIHEAGGTFEKKDLGNGLAGLYLSFPEGGEGDA
jgi:hypothetical protein